VRFRLSLSVPDLSLHPDGVSPLLLHLRRDHGLTVRLATIEAGGRASLDCYVETEFTPGPSVSAAFAALSAGKMPTGSSRPVLPHPDAEHIDDQGNIRGGLIPSLSLMPESFQEFARQLNGELLAAATAAIGVLRWRSRTLGSPRPFSSRGVSWSEDGERWHRVPAAGSVEFGGGARLELTTETAAELQALIDSDGAEPLGHVLFREAWSQRQINPRGSLLMAMTALEVGIKQYITHCVPQAEWLMDNVPSPPVVRMLSDYLPQLVPPLGPPGLKSFADDDPVLKALRKALQMRNNATHTGTDVSRDDLRRTLRAVRIILWQLDEARGHIWASQHLPPSLNDDLRRAIAASNPARGRWVVLTLVRGSPTSSDIRRGSVEMRPATSDDLGAHWCGAPRSSAGAVRSRSSLRRPKLEKDGYLRLTGRHTAVSETTLHIWR
jgi:hypothetical protein